MAGKIGAELAWGTTWGGGANLCIGLGRLGKLNVSHGVGARA